MHFSQGRIFAIGLGSFILQLLSLCLILLSARANADSLPLSQLNHPNTRIDDYLYVYPLGEHNVDDKNLGQLSALAFMRNNSKHHSPHLAAPALYRLTLINDTPTKQKQILAINNPMVDRLDLFLLIQHKLVKQIRLGDNYKASQPLLNSIPHIEFELASNIQATIYIQVVSQGTTTLPLSLHSPTTFQTKVYQSFFSWGAFIGIILMILTYNTLLYFSSSDKIYLCYFGYTITMLVQLGSVYGYGFHLFPFALQSFFQQKIVVLNYLISLFAILFALYFLRYEREQNNVYKLSLHFCALLGVLGIFSLFAPQDMAAKIYYPLQLLVFVVIGRICLPSLLDEKRWSKLYLLSWLPLFVGTATSQLLLLGLIAYSELNHYALMIGVVFEIGIISFALAERFRAKQKTRLYDVTHDSVTALPNHILLTECISRLMARQQSFTLILFRAEQFGEIKPALGLVAANNLVIAIVDSVLDYFSAMQSLYIFERQNKTKDIRLSRISDDTFGLLLMGSHDEEALSYIVLTIQEAVSNPINVGGYHVSTQCIVGAVSYPENGLNADMVLQKAMHSLDIATRHSDKYAFYSPQNNSEIQAQLQLAADLQQAIDNDELALFHQVQIDLNRQIVYGNEALARWRHPTKGWISPEVFIGLAETTGLINQLSEWVVAKALAQHQVILNAGYAQHISINLSAKDLTQAGLIAHIITTITQLNLDPKQIIFELTESATSNDPIHTQRTINQLHELNFKVAIDDFGTGYSSMEYLSTLPFHELKIDKSFVMNLLQNHRDKAITKTTIEMAKNLGLYVVAEGIENEVVERLLKTYGCEIGQGYYYAKPMPLNDYLKWLANNGKYQNKTNTSLLKAEALTSSLS